ncbi:MAG: glycosyltransferase family 2 protein [Anaerolineae bacterium]|nr:glycosyltransferase family 2 protein [Phycisphaerae bacterium]
MINQPFDGKRLLCVVVPVHNEASNLPTLVARIQAQADQLDHWDVELLLIDDGSTDDSVGVIRRLRGDGIGVGYVRLSKNCGHQAALCAGLEMSTGDAIITMDSDLQHPPEEIPRMIAEFERGADVVQMVRSDPSNGGKGFLSRVFYQTFNRLSDTQIVPNAADFRLMSRRVLDALLRIPEREKFLRGMIPALGFKQVAIEFQEAQRLHGTPSYTFRSSLKLARKALFDYSTVPLHFVFWAGMIIAGLSFLFGLGHLAWKLIAWSKVEPGFTDLITAIFFLSGCVMASVGILGRYMIMILEQVRGRPPFIVMDHIQGTPLAGTTPAVKIEEPAKSKAKVLV